MSVKTETLLLKPETLLSPMGIDAASNFYRARTLVNLFNGEELAGLQNYAPSLLPFYLTELDAINTASFAFLNKVKKEALQKKLTLIYFLLYAQYQLESTQGRQYNLKKYRESMERCAALMDQLRVMTETDLHSPEQQHQIEQVSTEKYLKFTGMIVGQWLADRLQELYGLKDLKPASENAEFARLEAIEAEKIAQGEFASGNTAFIKKWMGAINERRLYWVWGGGMLASVLDLLSDDFFNKQQTQTAVSAPSPFTGYMSWLLYYARFILNMILVLKHTFVGPWMTTEEQEAAKLTSPWQRFTGQLKERKFALLNDSIWATANLVCFFWLKGPGWMGWGGNLATAALLAMDLVLSVIRYFEEETNHKQHIAMLNKTIGELRLTPGNEERIAELHRAIVQAEFNWKYKKYSTINDIAYSAGLLIAFAVVCCGFAPPGLIAAPALLIVAAVGAALCFTLTVIYSAVTSGIEMAKTKATAEQMKKEYDECFNKLLACQTEYKRLEGNEEELLIDFSEVRKERREELEDQMRVYYLMLKDFEAGVDYQNRLARFQSVKLVRSIVVDACIPVLIFASFTFMPLPIAIAVLAAGLLLAGLSYLLINRFEPKPAEKAVLDGHDNDFAKFLEKPVNAFNKQKSPNAGGFFSPVEEEKSLLLDTGENRQPDSGTSPDLLTI
ncbi:hypothetical protein Lrub_2773 [Legionella rubrilucens]|uniref:Coiled-coil protein n=1 Tax=Legionella rubrilucens TaxID=458 RepID=A0A0W0XN40_9GAMM|nr:hypothetical protein [Legionella rubrilucens]KTD45976.1 hypothetical protein Lrub_2773 [Legionella rubrilucens]